jgi:IclR family pca regulon transcriptional regulator
MVKKKKEPTHPTHSSRGSSTLYVSSVEKGFEVLNALRLGQSQLGQRDLSLSQIAQLANMDKSSAQRFTNTLVALGYISKDPVTRRYRPAVKLADLYYTYLISNRLAEIAMPRLIEASKVYGTTISIGELSGTDIIYTVRIPHEKASYNATIPGRRRPAFCTAAGTVILAQMSEDEREQVLSDSNLEPITDKTIYDLDEIRARIEKARDSRYDVGVDQCLVNEISTATPVFNSEGQVVAAVQIPVYRPQWSVEEVHKKIVPLAIETALTISGSL